MSYKHRVHVEEKATPLFSVRRISAALPVVFGTAPVRDAAGPIEVPKLIYSFKEFEQVLGYDAEVDKYTLCEFADVFFRKYAVAPVVFVNVLDPAAHKASVTSEEKTFADDKITLAKTQVLTGEAVKDSTETTTYVKDTDYTIDYATGVITRISTGSIGATETVKVTYDHLDPSAVTKTDIIGGVSGATKTGLELVDEVFPRFRLVPGLMAAPGFSHEADVASALKTKAANINGMFKALAVIDVSNSEADYTNVPGLKNTNNLTDPQMLNVWPKVEVGSVEHWGSSHFCGIMAATDYKHKDIPYKSPSNERAEITGVSMAGTEIWLGLSEAEYLNGQGIATFINFIGGFKGFGNRTGAYPAVTDVKDAMLPNRRMANWLQNTAILTLWQKLDMPITRRNIETVLDSFNIFLNGLKAAEVILDGRMEFPPEDNPYTDVIDGILKFNLYYMAPPPAREILIQFQVDPTMLENLFGGE